MLRNMGITSKTAQEMLEATTLEWTRDRKTEVLTLMKAYAKQVAEQALLDAHQNIRTWSTPYDQYGIEVTSEVEQSIIQTEIVTP
jgi:hypothetical protein